MHTPSLFPPHATRNNARTHPLFFKLFRKPDDHWRFSRSTEGQVANDNDRQRKIKFLQPAFFITEFTQGDDNTKQPGGRQQKKSQRRELFTIPVSSEFYEEAHAGRA